MAISKVVYGGNTLIDLTADTVSADKVLAGIKAHGADGEAITGTCAYDADTTDATVAAEITILWHMPRVTQRSGYLSITP